MGKSWILELRDWCAALAVAALCVVLIRWAIVEPYHIPTASMENTLMAGDYVLVNKFLFGIALPFTEKKLPAIRPIQINDVIVFRFPGNLNLTYIKRCVGLPGDELSIVAREVYINHRRVEMPFGATFTGAMTLPGQKDDAIVGGTLGFNKDHFGPISIPKKGDRLLITPATLPLYESVIRQEGYTIEVIGDRIWLNEEERGDIEIKDNYYFVLGDNRDLSLDSRYWGLLPEREVIGLALFVFWSWEKPNSGTRAHSTLYRNVRYDRIGKRIR